jgi:hypothetical protein
MHSDKEFALKEHAMNVRTRIHAIVVFCTLFGLVAAGGLVRPAAAQLAALMSQGLTVTETVTANGKTSTTTTYFGGNATKRSSADGQDSIVRFDQEKIISIDNKKKTYSEITFQQLQDMMSKVGAAMPKDPEAVAAMQKIMGGSSAPLTVTKQGAGETIVGYATERYLVTGPMEMEIWAAPDLQIPAAYYDAIKMRIPENPVFDMRKMYDAFKQIKGMSLKSVMKMKVMSMNISTTTEVTSVKKGAIPPATFDVPAGYKLVQEKF